MDETTYIEWVKTILSSPLLQGVAAVVAIILFIFTNLGSTLLAIFRNISVRLRPRRTILSPGLFVSGEVFGRDKDVDEIHALLRPTGRNAARNKPGVVLKGLGGLGKSTLARHYARKYSRRYHGVWWIDAETAATVISGFCALGQRIGVAGNAADNLSYARTVASAMGDRDEDWLLIFDNAWSSREISEWRHSAAPRQRLLVTTREGGWPDEDYSVLEPGKLAFDHPKAPAVQLLLESAEATDVSDRDRGLARDLAEKLDGLPLALVAAGVEVRDGKVAWRDMAAKIDLILTTAIPSEFRYRESVFAALSLSLDRIVADQAETDADGRPRSDAAREKARHEAIIVDLFCWLAPDGLEARLLTDVPISQRSRSILDDIPDGVLELCKDAAAVNRALDSLVRRSLLERRDGGFSMHRLTQATARARLAQTGAAADWARAAAAVVAASYPGGLGSPALARTWPVCARLTPHVAALAAHPPPTAAMDFLFNQASLYLDRQRRDAEARRFASASLKLKKRRLPKLHRDLAVAYSALGVRLGRAGRWRSAEVLAREAVRIGEENAEIGDANRAVWYSNHGSSLQNLGAAASGADAAPILARAAQRFQQALALDRRTSGPTSHQVAKRLSNLAGLRATQACRAADASAAARKWAAAIRLER